ncbi:MAG: flagellar hook-basal body complex protein FliE [Firmicutes bacterium HGW-Firmicutes-1]|jgi:flagellar hook-basal body complex protein FliE|nr:MAG: flagellar hook-basal body complex protein FliE [Firmicutes bacterium HGW-Firmicutes-1]
MALNVQELSKIGNIVLPGSAGPKSNNVAFDELYKSAIGMLDETNQLQKTAEQKSMDFALGKIDNIHDVMIAQEKANIALQYTVKMKNAVMDAYNEIMRMQL